MTKIVSIFVILEEFNVKRILCALILLCYLYHFSMGFDEKTKKKKKNSKPHLIEAMLCKYLFPLLPIQKHTPLLLPKIFSIHNYTTKSVKPFKKNVNKRRKKVGPWVLTCKFPKKQRKSNKPKIQMESEKQFSHIQLLV